MCVKWALFPEPHIYYIIIEKCKVKSNVMDALHRILGFHIPVSPIITKLQSFYSAKGDKSNAANCAFGAY